MDQRKLREYEIQKLKYYYGVVYCNDAKTADELYQELDGKEFELSNLQLDLRVIPDDMDIPHKAKESVTTVPESYECKFFVSRVKGHSNCQLSWEQTDPKRYQFLTKRLEKDKLDEFDYNDYLASSNSSDSESVDEEKM